MKRQAVNNIRRLFSKARALPPLAALVFLGACADMQQLGQWRPDFMQEKFTPLNSEVAALAAPGDAPPVLCALGKGSAHFADGWSDFRTVNFMLPGNGTQASIPVSAARGDKQAALKGFYDEEGQKMIFCPVVSGPPDARVDCFSLYVLGEDLDSGVKRTFDVPDAIRGASITCAREARNLQGL